MTDLDDLNSVVDCIKMLLPPIDHPRYQDVFNKYMMIINDEANTNRNKELIVEAYNQFKRDGVIDWRYRMSKDETTKETLHAINTDAYKTVYNYSNGEKIIPMENKDDPILSSISQQFIDGEFDKVNKRLANLESICEDMRNILYKVRFA